MGLAERIRQAKRKNLTADELKKEKTLLNNLNLTIVTDGTNTNQSQKKPSPSSPKIEKIINTTHDQLNGQTDRRTDGQTDGRTDKRTDGINNELFSGQTALSNGQTPARLIGQTDRQTTKQTSGQTRHLSNGQTDKQTVRRSDGQTTPQTDRRSDGQTTPDKRFEIPIINLSVKPNELNVNQYRVLHHIYFNRPYIEAQLEGHLQIPYSTIRNCVASLRKKGYIEKPFRENIPGFNGSTCRVNELKCIKLFGDTDIENPTPPRTWQTDRQTDGQTTGQTDRRTNGQTTEQTDRRSIGQTTGQTDRQTNSSYNSKYVSIIENLLTRPGGQTEWDWWQSQGATPEILKGWCDEFSHIFTPDQIIDQMQIYFFNATDPLGKKPEVDTSYLSHFWGILNNKGDRKGKPKNYRNILQREAQELEANKQQTQKALDEIKKLNEEANRLKLELEFERILSNISADNSDLIDLAEGVHSIETRKVIIATIKDGRPLKKNYINQLRGIFMKEYN